MRRESMMISDRTGMSMDGSAVCYRCRVEYDPSCYNKCPSCGWRNRTGGMRVVLLWLAVLPAAVLALFVVAIVIDIAAPQVGLRSTDAISGLARSVMMGYGFVVVGSHLAPKKHPAVPLVLASIYCAVLVLLVYAVVSNVPLSFEGPRGLAIVSVVVGIAAAFGTAVHEAFYAG